MTSPEGEAMTVPEGERRGGPYPEHGTGAATPSGPVPGPGSPQAAPVPRTGHPAVDDMLTELDAAASLPPAEQVEAFEAGYRRLETTLGTIDEG